MKDISHTAMLQNLDQCGHNDKTCLEQTGDTKFSLTNTSASTFFVLVNLDHGSQIFTIKYKDPSLSEKSGFDKDLRIETEYFWE